MQPDFSTLKPVESAQPDFESLKPASEISKPTGLQAFLQSIIEKPLKLLGTLNTFGRTAESLVQTAIGNKEKGQQIYDDALKAEEAGYDYGYFGNVKPIKSDGSFQSVKEAVDVGTDIGTTIAGGGGTAGVIKTGLKGLIKEGLKEGAKVGATTFGLNSFGDSLANAEDSPMDVAYNTLFGTAIGGITGGLAGGTTPIVSKVVNYAKNLTKVSELENKLSEGFKKILNPTARQLKSDTRFGNDSFNFLAKEMPDIPLEVNSTGRIEADNAIEMAKQKYAAESTAYKAVIRNSGKYIDIDNVIANAKAQARKEFDGSDLLKAEKQIDDEVNAYLFNNPKEVNVLPNGKRYITISRADDIKSYSWARGKGWGSPDAEVWNDTNNLIGHSIKDAIEKELPDVSVKAMNKRLGQWKNAIDLLEKRNNQVSGSGGKLSKYIIKATGTSIGAGFGGDDTTSKLTGAGAGFLTATTLASLMANPKVRLFAVRQLLNRLKKAGRTDMIEEAEQILKEQASKYLLPATGQTSYIEKPIITTAPTTYEKQAQKINTSMSNPSTQYKKDVTNALSQKELDKRNAILNKGQSTKLVDKK